MARPLKNRLDKQYEMSSHFRAVQMKLRSFLDSNPDVDKVHIGGHVIERKKLISISRGEKTPSHNRLSEISNFLGSSIPPAP